MSGKAFIPLDQKRLEKEQVTYCIHPFGGHVPQDLLLQLVTAIWNVDQVQKMLWAFLTG